MHRDAQGCRELFLIVSPCLILPYAASTDVNDTAWGESRGSYLPAPIPEQPRIAFAGPYSDFYRVDDQLLSPVRWERW